MYSVRPWNTHTVPLRFTGGAQRANRSSAPSGVLIVPVTTSSGTGLAGIETSVMEPDTGVKMLAKSKQRRWEQPLEAHVGIPISPMRRPFLGCAQNESLA